MNENEIKRANFLIAQFMEEPIFKEVMQYNESFKVERSFNYHSSWDAIMEVIEKIEKSNFNDYNFNFNITGDGICVCKYDDGSGIIANRVNEWGESKLISCYQVVVEFIKWYVKENSSPC